MLRSLTRDDARRARSGRIDASHGPGAAARLSESRVVVVGGGVLGGLVGQQLAQVGVGLLVVDCDVVESPNLGNQAFEPRHVGRPKAVVRAEQYRALNPECDVSALVARIEDCGIGLFRDADLFITGLDSRPARMVVCNLAERLGVPWLDAGVDASGRRLGSVTFYDARDDASACYLCRFSSSDLAEIAREGRGPGCPSWRSSALPVSPPTLASSSFAGIISSCQALHAVSYLLDGDDTLLGKQLLVSAAGPLRVSTHDLVRSARCAMRHEPFGALTRSSSRNVGELLAEARIALGAEPSELRLFDRFLVAALRCDACGTSRDVWRLREALSDQDVHCDSCGEDLSPSAMTSSMTRQQLSKLESRTWEQLGLPACDVVSVRAGDADTFFIVDSEGSSPYRPLSTASSVGGS